MVAVPKKSRLTKSDLQADRIEDLRAAIGLVGGDAHLGHHLEQALVDRLDVALDDLVLVHLLRHLVLHGEKRLEGQIGIDRLGAVTGKAREMMDLARLAGFHHEADGGAQALADQVIVHRRRCEQSGDRDAVRPDHAVRQDDDVVAAMNRRFGAVAKPVERAVERFRAELRRIGDVESLGVEAILEMPDAADLLEILVGEDGLAHFQPLAARGAFEIEDVRARADERHEAHDELFADRVDRRVRDLREVLLEIGVEQLRLVGERRDRRVRTHRADRFLAGHRHGLHEQLEIFLRVAEGLLTIEQRHVGARLARLHGLQVLEHDLRALQPFLVGMRVRKLLLDFVVGDDAAFIEVDEQHLAGLQAATSRRSSPRGSAGRPSRRRAPRARHR